MEAVNDALKYVVQARKLLKELCICYDCSHGTNPPQCESVQSMNELLEKAEEALVKTK